MKRLILSSLLLIALPAIAYSHTSLLSSDPPRNAVLQSPPQKVTVNFLGAAEPAFSKLEVFDSKGNKVSKKAKFLEENTVMEVELSEGLKSGEFSVKWICIGLDGHKTQGSYKFTVK